MTEPKKYRIIPRENVKSGREADVFFTNPMDPAEWKDFRTVLLGMIKKGYGIWKFDLKGVEYPSSTDPGMWVTCNATVSSQGGSIEFLVPPGSNVRKVLALTRLDTILTISDI